MLLKKNVNFYSCHILETLSKIKNEVSQAFPNELTPLALKGLYIPARGNARGEDLTTISVSNPLWSPLK